MNRRSFSISTLWASAVALATLPFIRTAPPPALANYSDAALLQRTRDLLIPGIYAFNGNYPHLRFDLTVDTNALIVSGYNTETKANLGFAITLSSIRDGLYVASFRPSMEMTAKMLNEPQRTAELL